MSGEANDLQADHARALALVEQAGHAITESRFDDSYFGGAWFITFQARSFTYQLVWDPRDALLRLDRDPGPSVVEIACRRDTSESSVQALLDLVDPQLAAD